MATPRKKSKASVDRERIRKEVWPQDDAWTGEDEVGWFFAPRTLPLILNLLDSKEVSEDLKPSLVYLDLWSRHVDGGVVVMASAEEHAFAAGYRSSRGVRTWQERMRKLEELGFIKTHQIGNKQYKYTLLIHPTTAVQGLRDRGMVSDLWWNTYRDRQREAKEPSYEERQQAKNPPNVVKMPRKELGESTRTPKAAQGG